MKHTSRFTIARAAGSRLLRIPATSGASLRVNGRAAAQPTAGKYAVLERNWCAGDTIDLTCCSRCVTLPIDDTHPTVVALLRGAVLFTSASIRGKNWRKRCWHCPRR
ncbi:MAG: glycoside hydrolase family 127 protein [Blastocatellia bacterium]